MRVKGIQYHANLGQQCIVVMESGTCARQDGFESACLGRYGAANIECMHQGG